MSSNLHPGLARTLDPVLDAAIAAAQIVGTVVVVAQRGKIIYRRATGLADREASRPVVPETLFRYASRTKPIVSAAALALIEAGKLHLDELVTRWLPDFRPRLADGTTPTITVRQLLTHTAGLDYGFMQAEGGSYLRAGVSDGMDQPGLSMEENLRRIAGAPLFAPPGTVWHYSLALDVLGAVLERAGGAPLPELVRRLVTGPLGIEADFQVTARDRLAVPYADATPRPIRMGEPERVPFVEGHLVFSPARAFDARSYPSAGTSMIGTADAFVRFLEAIRAGGTPILRAGSARAMTSNQIGPLAVELLTDGIWRSGFGFAVLEKPDATTPFGAGTFRWGGVYGNAFFVDPSAELVVVGLSNTAVAGMIGPFPDAVQRAVYAGLTE